MSAHCPVCGVRDCGSSHTGDADGVVYPMTPVDCLISELRDLFYDHRLSEYDFERRIAQFKVEVAAPQRNRMAEITRTVVPRLNLPEPS